MIKFIDSWGRVHAALTRREAQDYADADLVAMGPTGVALPLWQHYSDLCEYEQLIDDGCGNKLLPNHV